MYIQRQLTHCFLEAVQHFPCVVLTGSRQVGKTTFIQKLLPDHHYVTLDRPLTAEQAEEDPEAFLQAHPAPVVIDEVQYAPSLFRFLKTVIDQNRDQKGQFILTGSQKFLLMQGVGESLAGRAAILELEGLSCEELLAAGLITQETVAFEQWMVRGGFPELWVDPTRPTQLFLDSYIATYLERDVRHILAVGSLRDYERFLKAAALRTGQQLNKSMLAREVGVSVSTISQWLSVLEALGHVVLLEPWFVNMKKRLVKSPKLYFSDVGLVCGVLGITQEALPQSTMIGALWETFVFAELRKRLVAQGGGSGRLWYYRDQQQNEVDFIVEQGLQLHLFECKWTASPQSRMAANLNKLESLFENAEGSGYRVASKTLVSRSSECIDIGALRFRSPVAEGLFCDV